MKNKINIYWGEKLATIGNINMLTQPLIPVLKDYKDQLSSIDPMNGYLQCPAVSNYFKNTYVIKSPVDFEMNIDPNTLEPKDILLNNEASLPPMCFFVRSKIGKNYDLGLEHHFFADSPIEMEMLPATLHSNEFTTFTRVYPGKFDIGRWFRPLLPSYRLEKSSVKVKRGDALYYVKFDKDKSINLVNFEVTEKIEKLASACLDVKRLQPGFKFKSIYSFFERKDYKQIILKEIKNTITSLK